MINKLNLSIKDKSEFLRGFLILIRKDEILEDNEKRMAMIIGKHFGFSHDFCQTAIGELMDNDFISEDPPVFSRKEIAEVFADECQRILTQIHEIKNEEINFLKRTIELNNRVEG